MPAPPPHTHNPPPPPQRYLFDGVELTAREKADLAYKQRVYDLALERKNALEGLVDDGYSMPTNYGEGGGGLRQQGWAELMMCCGRGGGGVGWVGG